MTDPVSTLLGGGTVGAMARIYESKPVRNALIRINAVRGDRRDRAFREAEQAIQSAIQASRSATYANPYIKPPFNINKQYHTTPKPNHTKAA